MDALFKLIEAKRAVVQGRGQTKAEVHQGLLARTVAVVHAADLRHADMGLVNDQEIVLGKIVEQVRRRRAFRLAGQVAAVIFDPVAITKLADHFQVEHGPLLEPLRLDQAILRLQFGKANLELILDRAHRLLEVVLAGDKVAAGKDGHLLHIGNHHSAQRVDDGDSVNGIAEKLDPDRPILFVHREDVDRIAAHAKGAAMEGELVAFVEHEGQAPLDLLHWIVLAFSQ